MKCIFQKYKYDFHEKELLKRQNEVCCVAREIFYFKFFYIKDTRGNCIYKKTNQLPNTPVIQNTNAGIV